MLGRANEASVWRRVTELSRAARIRLAENGVDPDQINCEVDASPLVPTGDVLKAVDAFVAADMLKVTFIGTPKLGSAGANRAGR